MNYKRIFSALFLFLLGISLGTVTPSFAETNAVTLPGEGTTRAAINYDYFPNRLHAFIFRNWPVVSKDKLAKILETTPENVEKIAFSMGLPPQKEILPAWSNNRGYITVLRRNWHLLPYDQLIDLLGFTREEMAFKLIEDDFLFVKLGWLKPFCEKLTYSDPTEEETAKAKKIAGWLTSELGAQAFETEEERFSFIDRLKNVSVDFLQSPENKEVKTENKENKDSESNFELRYIASYFASFGEPLLDPEIESYPEGLLQRLQAAGVNGIWLHTVLRTLVPPTKDFPEFGKDYEKRIAGLNKLVQRAKRYGIGVYIYINEPRAMSLDFYDSPLHKDQKGPMGGSVAAMCTSDPKVRQWLTQSMEYVFKSVPDLAGAFTISASENLTSCASHGQQGLCPRCKDRTFADIITEVNTLIAEGVHRGNPNAKTIVWDWGWQDQYAEEIIQRLPKHCWFMSVSEWELPITRGGIASNVGEYSISSVGPGPRAKRHWGYAKEAGLKTVAKVQVNCSWEFSAIPHLPVLNLVAQHAQNLSEQHVNGLMLSWSLGGYPSQNLALFQAVAKGNASIEENLKSLAISYYGTNAAPQILKAWQAFSDGFREYPYNGSTLYHGPQHMGASNPLFWQPTGYNATMVGLPYDNLQAWCSIYSPEIWIGQMELVRKGFENGCKIFEDALPSVNQQYLEETNRELTQYKAAEIHFSSCVNQATFTHARNQYLALDKKADDYETLRVKFLKQMQSATEKELENATKLFALTKIDSAIGYESSNHYFYIPQDLAEKIINCKTLLGRITNELK